MWINPGLVTLGLTHPMFDALPQDALIPLTQSDAYARAVRKMGGKICKISLGHGGALGQTLMLERCVPVLGQIGLISRGPIWREQPDLSELTVRLRTLGHPVLVNAECTTNAFAKNGFIGLLSGATVARLDLTGDVRARMHQKWRNRLRRAEDSALRVSHSVFPHKSDHWLLRAETLQRAKRKYRGLSPAFAVAYAQTNPHQTRLFIAKLNAEPVAAMLFLRHGRMATYHIGYTSNLGRVHNAHTLLLSHAAEWLAAHGTDVLDLGTLDTLNAPGLARFKLGSGAQAHRLGGTWLFAPRWTGPARFFQAQVPSAAARIARMFSP